MKLGDRGGDDTRTDLIGKVNGDGAAAVSGRNAGSGAQESV